MALMFFSSCSGHDEAADPFRSQNHQSISRPILWKREALRRPLPIRGQRARMGAEDGSDTISRKFTECVAA